MPSSQVPSFGRSRVTPIACRARRMDRHNHDVSYLSQDRTRSKARSRASHGNYRRSRDNAATVADLEVSSVEPEIRSLAFYRSIEDGVDPFINVFAQVGDLALR